MRGRPRDDGCGKFVAAAVKVMVSVHIENPSFSGAISIYLNRHQVLASVFEICSEFVFIIRGSTSASRRASAARLDPARQATTISAAGVARRRWAGPLTDWPDRSRPAFTAMAGRKETPRPETDSSAPGSAARWRRRPPRRTPPSAASARRRPWRGRAGSGRLPEGSMSSPLQVRSGSADCQLGQQGMVGGHGGQQFVVGDECARVEVGACRAAGRSGPRPGLGLRPSGRRSGLAGQVLAQVQPKLGEPLRAAGAGRGAGRKGAMVGITPRRNRPDSGWPALAGGLGTRSSGIRGPGRPGQRGAPPPRRPAASGDHPGTPAVDHRRAQNLLQFLYAGGQRRLGHVRSLGGAG